MSMAEPTPEHFPGSPSAIPAVVHGYSTLPAIAGNNRAAAACGEPDARRTGKPMIDSHDSLRDDHTAAIVASDEPTELLRKDSFVHGARLAGAGRGEACAALCRNGMAAAAGRRAVPRAGARANAGVNAAAAKLSIPASLDARTPMSISNNGPITKRGSHE